MSILQRIIKLTMMMIMRWKERRKIERSRRKSRGIQCALWWCKKKNKKSGGVEEKLKGINVHYDGYEEEEEVKEEEETARSRRKT